ncbi:MAG: hypothetical protein U0269_16570 [Polyangiales bacterium]
MYAASDSLDTEPSGAVSNTSARPFADTARPLAECVADALRGLTFEPARMTAKVQFSIAGDAPDNAIAAQR